MVFLSGLLRAGSQGYALDDGCCGPFGGYCKGSDWGWYGAGRTVITASDAKKLLQEYYVEDNLRIGKIIGKEGFFEAEIKDRNDTVIDIVIVDKRTGRIRSIY